MPLGVTSDAIRDMSIGGLRELNDIAGKMVTLTKSYKAEYAELEAMTKAEISRRSRSGRRDDSEYVQAEKNRAADNAKILKAKQVLADHQIDINIFPNLVSEARIYQLATLMEAADAIASKNPYLTQLFAEKCREEPTAGPQASGRIRGLHSRS